MCNEPPKKGVESWSVLLIVRLKLLKTNLSSFLLVRTMSCRLSAVAADGCSRLISGMDNLHRMLCMRLQQFLICMVMKTWLKLWEQLNYYIQSSLT